MHLHKPRARSHAKNPPDDHIQMLKHMNCRSCAAGTYVSFRVILELCLLRSILDRAVSAVDAWVSADHLAVHGRGSSSDGGSTSSAALAALPPNAFAVTLFCLESRQVTRAVSS